MRDLNFEQSMTTSLLNQIEEQEDQCEKIKTSSPKYNEYIYLGLNSLYVITNGINHFHLKFMKLYVKEEYDEYSFTIWRYGLAIVFNYIKMCIMKETIVPFNNLKGNVWFWVRTIIQFAAMQTFLICIRYFRVSTATCFISMSPVAIVIMSCLLLNEKFYMRYIYGILICFGGVMMIVQNEEKADATNGVDPMILWRMFWGVFWGISQLISVALHKVSSKALVKDNFDINTQIIYPSLACIVLSFIFIPIEGKTFHYSFGLIFHSGINSLIWVLSTHFMLISYKGIDLVKTTAIGYLNIVTVFILGILFLGEVIYFTDIVGSLIILGFNIYNTVYPPHG